MNYNNQMTYRPGNRYCGGSCVERLSPGPTAFTQRMLGLQMLLNLHINSQVILVRIVTGYELDAQD
jgi:hypothetical protein